MLRALGVPAVLGVPGLLARGPGPATPAVVDGTAGAVTLNPTAARWPPRAAPSRPSPGNGSASRGCAGCRQRPLDGEPVELQANLEMPAELPLIAQSGAPGIGLLRTEFLFMNRETLPDEAAQAEIYRTVVEAMGGDPVTIRVLDWGGEKEIEALATPAWCPKWPTTTRRSACAACGCCCASRSCSRRSWRRSCALSVAGPTRVLLPMVTNVGEVRAARETYDRVATPATPPGRPTARNIAAARHHDRDARRGIVGRCAGAGGGFLRHRHQ